MQTFTAQDDDNSIQMAAWAAIERENLDAETEKQFQVVVERIRALGASFRAKNIAIRSNGDSSEIGKRKSIAALILESDVELAKIADPMLATLEKAIVSAQRALASAIAPTTAAGDLYRQIEIRGQAYALDDRAVLEAMLERAALNGTDDFAVWAILAAPAMFPLVGERCEKIARTYLAERIAPDQPKIIDSAQNAHVSLLGIVRGVRDSFGTVIERNQLGIPDRLDREALTRGLRITGPESNAPGA